MCLFVSNYNLSVFDKRKTHSPEPLKKKSKLTMRNKRNSVNYIIFRYCFEYDTYLVYDDAKETRRAYTKKKK